MLRLQFHQLRIGGRRRRVVAHFEMDVTESRKESRIAFARFDGLRQQLRRALQLAFQVQRHGFRKRAIGPLDLPHILDRRHAGGYGMLDRGLLFYDLHGSVLSLVKILARGGLW